MELNELLSELGRHGNMDGWHVLHCADGLRIAARTAGHRMYDVMVDRDCHALIADDELVKREVAPEVILNAINLHGGIAGKTNVGALDVT